VSGSDTSYVIQGGRHSVGRLRDCDLSIDDESVSRRHAILEVTPDGLCVEDLGSANGTFVDEQRLTGRQLLATFASLRFGTVRVQIAPREGAESPRP
jgi:pSer/pThr/pTyr-binding forkhead associated (FHA) protein